MTEAAAAESAWRAKVEKTIAAGLETLTARSADGIDIAPLYAPRREAAPGPWRNRAAWSVAQRIDHPDVEECNRFALAELEGGADALTLVVQDSSFARGFGLVPDADLDLVLQRIELDFIRLRLDAGPATPQVARGLGALIEQRTLTSAALDIDLGYDPIGWAARTGGAVDFEHLEALLGVAERAGLSGCALLADARPYHEAGAGEALELAAVIATGVAGLRRLEATGLPLDAARRQIAALLPVDADVYLSLTKVRALRRLWARVEAASGLEPQPLRVHAETSWRMMTRRDPWTNVMRATAATFAAGLGGADVVTVLPFTLALGLPDAPARRLARNVQRVLIDESNLGMVDDPSMGAGGFEALTDRLCDEAWTLFQEIEREGGIERSLSDGALQRRIARTAAARAGDVATLSRGIVGTSRFPSLDAPEPLVLDVVSHPAPPRGDGALPCERDAAPYEALRDRADAMAADRGRPQVFLAALGAPAAFGTRATYAANFLAAAGIEAAAPLQEQDIAALAEGFAASGTAVACLCGTDKAYATSAADLTAALRGRGARRLLLAGREGEVTTTAGIDAFIHDGCDAPAILAATLDAFEA